MDSSKEPPVPPVESSTSPESKPQEKTGIDYRKDNWGYMGKMQEIAVGDKLFTVLTMPSGRKYIIKTNGQRERLDEAWFAKMHKRVDEEVPMRLEDKNESST